MNTIINLTKSGLHLLGEWHSKCNGEFCENVGMAALSMYCFAIIWLSIAQITVQLL